MSVSMVAECFQREIEASIQHLDRRRQRLSVGGMPSPLAHTVAAAACLSPHDATWPATIGDGVPRCFD
jgi:hypothetical protein